MFSRTPRSAIPFAIVVALSVAAPPASAAVDDPPGDPQARSLDELLTWVRLGEEVYVTVGPGLREVKGTLVGLSDNGGLMLRTDEDLLRIPEQRLEQIDLKYDDPIGNGALGGLVTGLVFAALLSLPCDSEYGACFFYSGLLLGGAGAGIGAGLDALHTDRRTVYAAPFRGNRLEVSAKPMVVNRGRGLALVLSW